MISCRFYLPHAWGARVMREGDKPLTLAETLAGNYAFGDIVRDGGQSSRFQAGRRPNKETDPPQVSLEFPTDGSNPNPADDDYLVKGLFVRRTCGTIVGAPGSAKTTFVLDLLFSVAHGVESYHGRLVQGAPGLYVGYEGEVGIRNRISAAFRHHGDPDGRFARLVLPEPLGRNEAGDRGERQIIAAALELQRITGEPTGIIAIDTKSRATAGDNEDSNGEAALFLQRVQRISNSTGACIIINHHPGKDSSKGPRGASANSGGDDFTLIIQREKNSNTRTVFLEKVRDDRDKTSWFSFDLQLIELRHDSDGQPVTAPVVRPLTGAAAPGKPRPRLSDGAMRALDMLQRLYADGKARDIDPATIGLGGIDPSKRPRVVNIAEWKTLCSTARLVPDGKESSERQTFDRAVKALERAGEIARYGEFVWILGQKREAAQ